MKSKIVKLLINMKSKIVKLLINVKPPRSNLKLLIEFYYDLKNSWNIFIHDVVLWSSLFVASVIWLLLELYSYIRFLGRIFSEAAYTILFIITYGAFQAAAYAVYPYLYIHSFLNSVFDRVVFLALHGVFDIMLWLAYLYYNYLLPFYQNLIFISSGVLFTLVRWYCHSCNVIGVRDPIYQGILFIVVFGTIFSVAFSAFVFIYILEPILMFLYYELLCLWHLFCIYFFTFLIYLLTDDED